MMEPFEVYQKYLALRTHFKSDSYDYFRYHGKLKANRDKFETFWQVYCKKIKEDKNAIIGVADYLFSRHEWLKKLRMNVQDVRDE